MTSKEKIFELRGKLYLETTRIEIKKRQYRNAITRAEKTASKLELLENKFIQKHKKMPSY